jgi:sulfopyruvate decarboxylase subunit beta
VSSTFRHPPPRLCPRDGQAASGPFWVPWAPTGTCRRTSVARVSSALLGRRLPEQQTVAMTHRQALEVLAARRGQHVVLTTHGSVDLWVSLSDTPLDFSYVPAAMGQGPSLGLGLALAQDRHGVVVVSGDGHLLMNLGCLVTLANHTANLYLIVMDNAAYEVTGGQPPPGAGRTDFAGLARAAGIRRVCSCHTVEAWRQAAAEALSGPGPVVIWLKVQARPGQRAPTAMRAMQEQLARLRQVLGSQGESVTAAEQS